MAAPGSSAVTIDRTYFETLLRRAEHNQNDGLAENAFSAALDSFVPVSREEYDNLLLVARQYANLKRSLMGAGVTEDHITTLIQDNDYVPPAGAYAASRPSYKRDDTEDGGARLKPMSQAHSNFRPSSNVSSYSPFLQGDGANHYNGFGSRQAGKHDWAEQEPHGDEDTPSYSAEGPTSDLNNERTFMPFGQAENAPQRPHYARMCKRTLMLGGLPDRTTHWDVTSVVRGGLLLDIFLRAADHMCLVSFLHEEDAVRFYDHARKNDIYINNKRVFIRWADRHFHLAGHVASKIGTGATRNMIIRRCDPKHTEDTIRDDLEHIHNLVVIKVEFIGGSCYIKTNSVHNAMFARTCMMSRATYKGSKIEWDVDECEQPIEVIQKMPPQPVPQRAPPNKAAPGFRNRFDMLRLDDEDNDETDDKFDTSSEMPGTVDVTA
ncbi:Uu.00g001850.m01.CDS01 [Anthostomella pinea]|uniref:Uu.00g001850.m01.CDS01 n=1 Tax=Anthostomella pinea TaxID=933095 RepID=A0AAI8VKF2_9PEZI|nr:Uu.00g001850.m01.CDS01 [Anthostomella pinea]